MFRINLKEIPYVMRLEHEKLILNLKLSYF